MSFVFSPIGFYRIGGVVLLALGIIGFTGVTNGIQFFQLDQGENIAHVVLGVVALAVGFGLKSDQLQRYLLWALLVLGVVATLWGVIFPSGPFANGSFTNPNAGFTNLENPADTILHLVVSVWIVLVLFMKQPEARPAAGRA